MLEQYDVDASNRDGNTQQPPTLLNTVSIKSTDEKVKKSADQIDEEI